MVWAGTGSMIVLLFAPLAAAQAFWVKRLWQPSQRGRPMLMAAAVLGLVPEATGALLLFEAASTALAPVGVPAGLVLLAGIVALGAVAPWLLDRLVPRKRAEWVLAGVLALPLLVFVTTLLAPDLQPDALYAWSGFQPLLGLSALLLGAVAPWLLAHWNAREARWDKTNAIALLVILVPIALGSGLIVFIGVSSGEATPADYTWQVTVEPDEEQAEWTVEVPFFITSPRAVREGGIVPISHAVEVRQALREQVEVMQGQAELTWLEEGSVLRIQGQGSVILDASYEFWGSPEAFNAWGLKDTNVSSAPTSTGNLTLGWSLELNGRSCFANADHELALAPGTTKPLAAEAGDEREKRPGLAHPWQVACT